MSDKILVCEMFGKEGKWAIQGEGLYVGVPSIFLRTFGCNLRCSFGAEDHGSVNQDVRDTAGNIFSLDECPIVETGCDTYYAIYSEFASLSVWMTAQEILDKLLSFKGCSVVIPHLVITGGEPLLPKLQEFWVNFLPKLSDIGIKEITFETNGTQELSSDFKKMVVLHENDITVNFSISPKLSNSGHTSFDTLKPHAVANYVMIGAKSWFKYVVAEPEDINEIMFFDKVYRTNNIDIPVYLMPQGGTRKEYLKNEPMVYELCSKYGYRFSPRLQVSAANNGVGI